MLVQFFQIRKVYKFISYHGIKPDATIEDTLKEIARVVNQEYRSPFVQLLVSKLYKGDKKQFLKDLFDYVCRNVRYQLDQDGEEMVWTPRLTVANKQGDCKKMTTLIASALKAAHIEPTLKHVFYADKDFTHIYPIVDKRQLSDGAHTMEFRGDRNSYIVLDVVNNCQYDEEVIYDKGSLYSLDGRHMNLHTMGQAPGSKYNFSSDISSPVRSLDMDLFNITGVGCPMNGNVIEDALMISGVGSLSSFFNKVKSIATNVISKVATTFSKVSLAIPRGAFLSLIRINALNYANLLAAAAVKDSAGLRKLWESFGGDYGTLISTIKAGTKGFDTTQIKGIPGPVPSMFPTYEALLQAPPLYHAMDLNNPKPFFDPKFHGVIYTSPKPSPAVLAVHPHLENLKIHTWVPSSQAPNYTRNNPPIHGMGQVGTIAAIGAAAVPIVVKVIPYLKGLGISAPSDPNHDQSDTLASQALQAASGMTVQQLSSAAPPDSTGRMMVAGQMPGPGGGTPPPVGPHTVDPNLHPTPTGGSFGLFQIHSVLDFVQVAIKLPMYTMPLFAISATLGSIAQAGVLLYLLRDKISTTLKFKR